VRRDYWHLSACNSDGNVCSTAFSIQQASTRVSGTCFSIELTTPRREDGPTWGPASHRRPRETLGKTPQPAGRRMPPAFDDRIFTRPSPYRGRHSAPAGAPCSFRQGERCQKDRTDIVVKRILRLSDVIRAVNETTPFSGGRPGGGGGRPGAVIESTCPRHRRAKHVAATRRCRPALLAGSRRCDRHPQSTLTRARTAAATVSRTPPRTVDCTRRYGAAK
jgi:hypothetical protein